MDWKLFKNKFHPSWHKYVRPWVESKDSSRVYANLRLSKKEIMPKSALTFRSFEQPLDDVKVVVYLEEPYCDKNGEIPYADGIALSCEYAEKVHPQLNEFYNALEREFYDMNLHILKEPSLGFYINQGVLFISSSLTVEIDSSGTHSEIWTNFHKVLIQKAFCDNGIPIIFCGSNIYEKYKHIITPLHPYFVIKQSLSTTGVGKSWETDNKFTHFQDWCDKNLKEQVMWVNIDTPF